MSEPISPDGAHQMSQDSVTLSELDALRVECDAANARAEEWMKQCAALEEVVAEARMVRDVARRGHGYGWKRFDALARAALRVGQPQEDGE